MFCSVCNGKGQAVTSGMTMTCPGCRGFGYELPPQKKKISKKSPEETPKRWKAKVGELCTFKFMDPLPPGEPTKIKFQRHMRRDITELHRVVPVKWEEKCFYPAKKKTYKGGLRILFDQGPSWVKTPADPTGKFLTESDLKKAQENPRKVLNVRVEDDASDLPTRIFLGGPHAKEFWSRLREEREVDPEKKHYSFFQWLDLLGFKVQLDLGAENLLGRRAQG